jgi:uncharacterized integral membrane protein (TIGR00697 family)
MRLHISLLIVLYTACLMIANVTAGRVTQLGPFSVPAAIYIFALSFTLIDLINQALGKGAARHVVYAALGANLLMAAYFWLVVKLPAPEWFGATDAYAAVLGQTPRIVLASLAAFLLSGLLDVELFAALRERAAPWLRVLLSNAASTLLDSIVFITLAFAGLPDFPAPALAQLIIGQYVVKMAVTLVSIPLIHLVKAGSQVDADWSAQAMAD